MSAANKPGVTVRPADGKVWCSSNQWCSAGEFLPPGCKTCQAHKQKAKAKNRKRDDVHRRMDTVRDLGPRPLTYIYIIYT